VSAATAGYAFRSYADRLKLIVRSALRAALRIHFGVIGEERAPTTGTEHLQCFFHFKCRKDISAVRAIVQGHWSAAKGTCEQNLEYCSKGGEFRVLGVIQTPLATGRASQVQQDKL